MAELTHKNQEINNLLDKISLKCFGTSRSAAIKTDTCIYCNKPATSFHDEKYKEIYRSSGLCQDCQDKIFDAKIN